MKKSILISFLILIGFSTLSQKNPTAGCLPPTSSTFLEINNVRALIHNGGDFWWDLSGNPRYEIPKGSGKHSLFAGALWLGGQDEFGNIYLAAQRFRSNGNDFWPGPLNSSGETSESVCSYYDRHFVTFREEVEIFNNWFNADAATQALEFPDYEIPLSILEWPAHGDVALGYDYYLAPFFDADEDGEYNPLNGDYPFYDLNEEVPCGFSPEYRLPRLYGHQNLWWVYNDNGNEHSETSSSPLKVEIRTQAFAFSTANELNNNTFYSNTVINKSTRTYYEMYIGVWTDGDLGYAFDDYAGCDVQRSLGYFYNGLEIDQGTVYSYGATPPMVGIDVFEGPYMDPDGIDDPVGCNNSINGLNFGDGIADNERLGLSSLICYNNTGAGNPATTDPAIAQDFYYYLQGKWKDGSLMLYGGSSHFSDTNSNASVPTKFMYTGTSDPCGYSTNGIPMPEWSEVSSERTPYDRRFVQSNGPFTFEPGEIVDLSYGVVWARAEEGDNLASMDLLLYASDIAQVYFDNCFRLIEGPDAPELEITAGDSELNFQIFNLPESNNYLEQYAKHDYTIITPSGYAPWDSIFRFQGYQVFQVINENVRVEDLQNSEKARLVFQCDLNDEVENLTNYEWNISLSGIYPHLMVEGNNQGIEHNFTISTDAFSGENIDTAVNYYYVAIAYSYNNYLEYLPGDSTSWIGQKMPYKPSRKSVGMNKVKVFQTNYSNTGIEFVNDDFGIQIFPNPFSSQIEISSEKAVRQIIQITDSKGRLVLTKITNKQKDLINTSNLSPGTYFFRFINEKGIFTKKAIKI
ncbi:MAG: T9SS type A sorting domain-containing protein [Bacteroidales bacterium]|nr:T9SS type A sorting domain-containing protein [Bacteroidales bacterium]